MLVLSRRRGEVITIGEDVQVVVLGVEAGRVRLGITAPQNVSVYREEVRQRMQEEANDQAQYPAG